MATSGDIEAADRWRTDLAAWRIPDPILAAAPESPWGFPVECFRHRPASDAEPTPTTRRALEALPVGGSVLDVGVGGGATSLPLAQRAGSIVGLDAQEDMLVGFGAAARSVGVAATTIHGSWPDVADAIAPADVVVCGHVLYNTPELGSFASALTGHARIRVVTELTDRHPLDWMRDLWRTFHGIERPAGPTAEDALAVVRGLGLAVHREDRQLRGPQGGRFEHRSEAIHLVRKRLCLQAERDDEIADALGPRLASVDGRWRVGPLERTMVTLWWDVA
jgi:SAM-dependent methyltransferase